MTLTKIKNGERVPLTAEEIIEYENKQAKAEIVRAEREAYEIQFGYREPRRGEYPPVEDQLDMLYHAMANREIPKAKEWFRAITEVKRKYPKPGEIK